MNFFRFSRGGEVQMIPSATASLRILSPLAEKRILLFSLRKQLLGRRAYSDCTRSKKGLSELNRKNADKEETQSSKIYDTETLLAG